MKLDLVVMQEPTEEGVHPQPYSPLVEGAERDHLIRI
jgi:hypothetical protein